MKKILFILIVTILASCQDNLITQDDHLERPYVIVDIESTTSGDGSRYFAETGTGYTYYMNDIEFIAEHGKFKIGDIVHVSIEKPTDEFEEEMDKMIKEIDSIQAIINTYSDGKK